MKRLWIIILIFCALLAVGIFVERWIAIAIGLLILGTHGYIESIFNIKYSRNWSIIFLVLFLLFSGWNIKITKDSKETANKQSVEIADLTEEKRELRKEVEMEKIARLKIEEKLAPRKLTKGQQETIAHKLSPFAGQEYHVTAFREHKEPLALANLVYYALNRAGWKYLKTPNAAVPLGMVAGVLVYVDPAADERTKKAADSLVSALTEQGIASEQLGANAPQNLNNRIFLFVGTKP